MGDPLRGGCGGRYVLVTAAHNEADHLSATINSVVSQTLHPIGWWIVDDRSTDATAEIVDRAVNEYPWIHGSHRNAETAGHSFRAKVLRLNELLAEVDFGSVEFVGILDADVTMNDGYFAELVARLKCDPSLGVVGGRIYELTSRGFRPQMIRLTTVAGAVQFFRSDVLSAILPFPQMPYGGEDAVMELRARARGWKVQTFTDLRVDHHDFVGSASGTMLRARFRRGQMYHNMGYLGIYELVRCVVRILERPAVFGAVAEFLGYLSAGVRHKPQISDPATRRYLHREQRSILLRRTR